MGKSFWEGYFDGAFYGAIGGAIAGGMGFFFTGAVEGVAMKLWQTLLTGGASGIGSILLSDLGDIVFKGVKMSLKEIGIHVVVAGVTGAAFAGIAYGLSKAFAALKLKMFSKGGNSSIDDWVNNTADLSKQSPLKIPSNATVKVQAKNGYDQITYKWSADGYNYEVRWHTTTPGAPEGQGNTWVVSRVTPGTPSGQARVENILVGDNWIPRYQWQNAINAYRNGTATSEQLQLLKDGHWKAP